MTWFSELFEESDVPPPPTRAAVEEDTRRRAAAGLPPVTVYDEGAAERARTAYENRSTPIVDLGLGGVAQSVEGAARRFDTIVRWTIVILAILAFLAIVAWLLFVWGQYKIAGALAPAIVAGFTGVRVTPV